MTVATHPSILLFHYNIYKFTKNIYGFAKFVERKYAEPPTFPAKNEKLSGSIVYTVFCYPYIYSSHTKCTNTDKLRILPRIREGQVILGPLQSIWLNEEYIEGTRR